MEKVINVNLGGRSFVITEDAYTQLNDYITSVKEILKKNEYCDEIMNDIEARISELCDKRLRHCENRIIDLALANEIINRIGRPEMFVDEESEEKETQEEHDAKNEEKENRFNDFIKTLQQSRNRKFFLNKDERIIGGVVAGVATYLNIDVTILRVIAVLLAIATEFFIPAIIIYMITWLLTPVAKTTAEKLQMQGITPTPENVAEKITNEEPATKNGEEPDSNKERKNMLLTALIIIGATYLFIPKITINGHVVNGISIFIFCFIITIMLVALLAYCITGNTSHEHRRKLIICLSAAIAMSILLLFIGCIAYVTI